MSRRRRRALVGDDRVETEATPKMFSEDFTFLLEARPGAHIFLGAGEGRAQLHTADYDFNDEVLALGAAYWVSLVEEVLGAGVRI